VTKDTRERFGLYSDNCKRCKHMDPREKRAWSVCHFSKGNEYCLASQVRFTIVGKAYRFARQVLSARDHRDAETEAKILALVAKEDADFQERFYYAIENPPKPESKQ
jgi:hypothetical protein